ncbi:aminodeoxychorismate synthase component I [Streptomyces kronopolitis]|uniref:aminodeoxychorismate synthase component I n=1 Tax=Streptomyces kronopolitis TaxID=1612435 RepID=UPI003D993132
MRTLLVDNHDSFTHNLFDYLARLSGHEPTVVRNDDAHWRIGHLADFDRAVVSPGPGNPARPADFGICSEIIQASKIPLLGVCLGHQGIALASGGSVELAPEPRHGRSSPVLHTGTDIFAGLPSPFDAVRYHSLAVTRLPGDLVVTAWTSDGVVMGLRHRDRELFGVQFHPESIGTEYGMQLLGNFLGTPEADRMTPRLSRKRVPRNEVERRGKRHAFAHQPSVAGHRLKFIAERLPTRWSDELAFERLYTAGPHSFWLDSSRTDGDLGRFSVMGDASGPLARVATADVSSSTVQVKSRTGTEIVTGDFLNWLDEDLRGMTTTVPRLPCDFALGWVGYLGYELKAECGGEAKHRAAEPDAMMVFADRAVVFDHQEGQTYLLALAEEDADSQDAGEDAARAWLAQTAARLGELIGLEPGPAPTPPAAGVQVELRHGRREYLSLIEACQDEIRAGESYEICLTNMAEAQVDLDPWQSYRRLRRVAPAPFAALLRFDELAVLSSSPERFLRVGADGTAESRPIKGTRPRGATHSQDAALVAELRTDEKELAENLMIVDLVRNDLGRCAEVGSVTATDVFRVETYATVHQLVSTVTATLRQGSSAVRCVQSAFPGGSMTGTPKERTMQIIDRLEGSARGIYSGAIGYFSLTGAADLSIVIRTAVLTPGHVRYGIGGAITALSDAVTEFEETAIKARPLLALTSGTFPGHRSAPAVPVSETRC